MDVVKLLVALVAVFLVQTASGAVMNENTDQLPPGCDAISGETDITVHAGRHYAQEFNGKTFTYDQREFNFEPCEKVTVTFVNNDSVRHQWMVHGLPMNIYPMGMFSIEVTGPGSDTGTFIVPSYTETLLVHCGVPQHMQKGMKAQIKIGQGDGNIANIPGITGATDRYNYGQGNPLAKGAPFAVVGFVTAAVLVALYEQFV